MYPSKMDRAVLIWWRRSILDNSEEKRKWQARVPTSQISLGIIRGVGNVLERALAYILVITAVIRPSCLRIDFIPA